MHAVWFEGSGFRDGYVEPLIEVKETESEIVIYVDLPFVEDKGDVSVEVIGDELNIMATMRKSIRWERWGAYQRTQSYSQYRTKVKLPTEVDAENSRATFKNGVLIVVLPKKTTKVKVDID